MLDLSKIDAALRTNELEAQREKEKTVNVAIRNYEERIKSIRESYNQTGAIILCKSLSDEYKILQEINSIADLSEEDLRDARELFNALNKIKDEPSKQAMRLIIKQLPMEKRRAIEALEAGTDRLRQRDIFSYLADNENDTCYLVSPANGEDNKVLTGNLEKKINLIFGECRVNLGVKSYTAINGIVSGEIKTNEIEFEPDHDLVNGFLLYTLLTSPKYSHRLAESVAAKFNSKEMQPELFRESKLQHRVKIIPFSILNYFANNNITRSSRDYVAPETRKRVFGLDFEATTSEGMVNEAINRFNSYGDELTVKDIQRVLGFRHYTGITRLFPGPTRRVKSKPGKPKNIYSRKVVEEYLKTHVPTGKKWLKRR